MILPEIPSLPWRFAALSDEESDANKARVVVVPVPYDATVSFVGGSREGPLAIINASRYLEDYDIEAGFAISDIGIHTAPEVEAHVGGPEYMINRVKLAAERWARQGKIVTLLGGEHSVSIGGVMALKETYPDLSVLYLDAHADFRNEYMGSKFSHACTARRISEICPIVEVGVRSVSEEEMDFINKHNVPVYFNDLSFNTIPQSAEDILASLTDNVYVSIDLDVLDPSLMPGVGTPEPGGMSWEAICGLLRSVGSTRRIVGFDLMELCPPAGLPSCAFTAAKLAYKTMGYATILENRV